MIQALCIHGQLEKGQSVLINSRTGDITLAAVTICLHYGCQIFVTVSNPEERQFFKKIFPTVSFLDAIRN